MVTLSLVCILKPELLYPQSLLSDPDWLQSQIPQSNEIVTISDNLSDEELKIIQMLMGEKTRIDFSSTSLQELQKNHVPKLSQEESFSIKILEPFPKAEQITNEMQEDLFKIKDQVELVHSNLVTLQEKRANDSFTINEIVELLEIDPHRAQKEFNRIEETLLLEDRASLSIQLLYHLDRWEQAETMSRTFMEELPDSIWVPQIYLYLQRSLVKQNKILDQDLILLRRFLAELDPFQANELLTLHIKASVNGGNGIETLRYRLEALVNPDISPLVESEKISDLLEEVDSVNELHQLSETFSLQSSVMEFFRRREIDLLIFEHRYREASELLEAMLKNARNSKEMKRIEDLENLRRRFSMILNVNPNRIGVILPLSSSHSRVSKLVKQTIEGLRLALLERPLISYKNSQLVHPALKSKEKSELELIFLDSKLNEDSTKSAYRELVEQENVIAVIGPLAKKTSEAAASEAQRWRVPMISLSLTSSIPVNKEYVFRNNQNWNLEVESLVRYARDYFQAKRFVILYSQTRESRLKAALFRKAVTVLGGKVIAFEDFTPNQKSFIHEFDTFTGKLKKMTIEEVEAIKELKEKEDPVRNFDAIFVAIGAEGIKDLKVIFPYAAVYQMEKTLFLGDSGWNHPALPFMPRYQAFRRLIFTDGYVHEPMGIQRKHFLNLHEKQMHRHSNYSKPSSYTAYAYDTLSLLRFLLKDESNHSHSDLKQALLNVKNFPGVTGILNFNSQGEIQRNMLLLTLKKGRITPIEFQ